jgi:hypothetical protein
MRKTAKAEAQPVKDKKINSCDWLEENILAPVLHQQYVFALPKLIRLFFRYRRRLPVNLAGLIEGIGKLEGFAVIVHAGTIGRRLGKVSLSFYTNLLEWPQNYQVAYGPETKKQILQALRFRCSGNR